MKIATLPLARLTISIGAVSLIAFPAGAFAGDSDWPQFRGPAASGIASGAPPVEWNGESGKNILTN
jgi:hypothetical protein